MGLIKTALKTAVAVKTAHVVHDRIERRKQAEWVASGHAPESFPSTDLGTSAGSVIGAATQWIAPGSAATQNRASEGDPVISQLQELADLKDRGMLTDEEFNAQKSRILGH